MKSVCGIICGVDGKTSYLQPMAINKEIHKNKIKVLTIVRKKYAKETEAFLEKKFPNPLKLNPTNQTKIVPYLIIK